MRGMGWFVVAGLLMASAGVAGMAFVRADVDPVRFTTGPDAFEAPDREVRAWGVANHGNVPATMVVRLEIDTAVTEGTADVRHMLFVDGVLIGGLTNGLDAHERNGHVIEERFVLEPGAWAEIRLERTVSGDGAWHVEDRVVLDASAERSIPMWAGPLAAVGFLGVAGAVPGWIHARRDRLTSSAS